MQASASGPQGAVSQGTELATITGKGAPCLDCPPASYTARQKNRSLNVQPEAMLHIHHPLSSSKPARECLCPSASENLRVRPRPRPVRGRAEGVLEPGCCKSVSPAWQPRVLACGPALPLACCDFGSLSLGFLIWAVRALEEKISGGFPIQ